VFWFVIHNSNRVSATTGWWTVPFFFGEGVPIVEPAAGRSRVDQHDGACICEIGNQLVYWRSDGPHRTGVSGSLVATAGFTVVGAGHRADITFNFAVL